MVHKKRKKQTVSDSVYFRELGFIHGLEYALSRREKPELIKTQLKYAKGRLKKWKMELPEIER